MKILYIICNNKEVDEVGYNVHQYLIKNYNLEKKISNRLCDVNFLIKDNNEFIQLTK